MHAEIDVISFKEGVLVLVDETRTDLQELVILRRLNVNDTMALRLS